MKNKKEFYYTLSVVTAGLSLVLFSVFLEFRTASARLDKEPYLLMGSWVQAQVDAAREKWGEHLQSGADLQSTFAPPLQKAKTALQTAFEGGASEWGAFTEFTDDEVLTLLRQAALDLDEVLAEAAKIRELQQLEGQPGLRDVERKVSEVLGKVSVSMATLQAITQKRMDGERQLMKTLFWISIGLVVLLFGVLSVWIFRLQRKRNQLERETSEKLQRDEDRMKQLTGFIEAVSAGDFSFNLDENSKDHVTDTLVRMRTQLKENAEQEQRRNWTTTGVAQIGEILRSAASSTELYDNIVKFIVKYTRSNQGGLFLLNDDDAQQPYLELVACYAFERKKFLTKKIDIGTGLVGQCYLEREKIHLTEIPEGYINITSGLGGTLPNSLLVVPLKVNEEVLGVLELASFNNYQPHEVELVEKFAESIGATVSSVKVNQRTRELLEQTQQQAEEMKAQEEEMRQNMEELSATQEELQRQMRESEAAKEQLLQRDHVFALTTILSEADTFGTITFVNTKLCQVSKYSKEELIGQGHNIFRHPDMPKELFKQMWQTIKSGQVFRGIIKNRAKDGTHYWVDATIVPVADTEGKVMKYIGARYHITNDELAEKLYAQQAVQLGLPAQQVA
ncbi:MAG: PAS domain-containing protein [Bacteroidota bacterium]